MTFEIRATHLGRSYGFDPSREISDLLQRNSIGYRLLTRFSQRDDEGISRQVYLLKDGAKTTKHEIRMSNVPGLTRTASITVYSPIETGRPGSQGGISQVVYDLIKYLERGPYRVTKPTEV